MKSNLSRILFRSFPETKTVILLSYFHQANQGDIMSQQQTKTIEHEKRAEWKRPEVRRMKAGNAETAGGIGGDTAFS